MPKISEDKKIEKTKPKGNVQEETEETSAEKTVENIDETVEQKEMEEEPQEKSISEEKIEEEEKIKAVEEELEKELEELKEEEKKEAIEEEKPRGKEEELEEEEIVEEKIYTIPLREVWITPPKKRAPKAIRTIKSFIRKHMKVGVEKGEEKEETTVEEEEKPRIIIKEEVNKKIWSRGIQKPPRKIRVRAVKDTDGNVTVYLAEGD